MHVITLALGQLILEWKKILVIQKKAFFVSNVHVLWLDNQDLKKVSAWFNYYELWILFVKVGKS